MIELINESVDSSKYIIVEYFLKSTISLKDAALNIAIGQSVGNPKTRSIWESDELLENHSCRVIANPLLDHETNKVGTVEIAFPLSNLDIDGDGISQFMCHIMGGHLDIDSIETCQVKDIKFPEGFIWKRNKFGIEGIRKFTGVYDKPLVGGIIKPKVCDSPELLLDMVKELVEGGVNFIKEDEIMSNPAVCPINIRVPKIMNYLQDKGVIYAVCINADPFHLLERTKAVADMGGNAVHINIWSGIGAYKAIRDLDLDLFLFYQKSGDKIITNKNHNFNISWEVLVKLAAMSGIDFMQAGMWGGYSSTEFDELKWTVDTLNSYGVMPSLSCGMHPGLVQAIVKRFGNDVMTNTGGAIHGHPMGRSYYGAKAMRDATDGVDSIEYQEAINKWGLLN